jgi:hypothetical protein
MTFRYPVPRRAHRGIRLYRGGPCSCRFSVDSALLTVVQKQCTTDAVAITHDDDLQLVEEVVRLIPNQNAPQGRLGDDHAHRTP